MPVIKGDYQLADDERIVYNRNGHLLINADGSVFTTYIDDRVEDFTSHFRYITRVDLAEWTKHWGTPAPQELDILDVAYWYKKSDAEPEVYKPADPTWRADEGEWLQKLRKGEGWP